MMRILDELYFTFPDDFAVIFARFSNSSHVSTEITMDLRFDSTLISFNFNFS
jgi:hypothetical protein